MCGIAGYIGPKSISAETAEHCLLQMRRRGPDHAAYRSWVTPSANVLLLHSRLRIIDLDNRSNQPFNAGSKWMTYNGELYNYRELRKQLCQQGVAFRTESDTEVLLEALNSWGWESIDRFEGMWAFAVYDESNQTLWLSRDRFGEKPLYYFRDDTGFYFGSEVKFIVALRGSKLTVNTNQLYRYLVNGYKGLYKTSETFFKGLKEVPHATVLKISADGKATPNRYWNPQFVPDENESYDEYVAEIRERTIRSVELRLRADVPLAFCMSGGIDSNTLISVSKKVFDYDVHGFTIMNSDARYEEQDLVQCAVNELGVRHTPIPLETSDALPRLRTLVRQHDAPVYTISYYVHWLLMHSIAQHGYRISVSGTGADELFTGYYDHHLAYLYQIRGDAGLYEESQKQWSKYVRPLVRNPYLGDPDYFVRDPARRDHIFLDATKFAEYLTTAWFEPFAETNYSDDLLRNRMMNEMFHEAVPVILHEDDLNAMYFSIENRSPFLDRALFEKSYSVPTRYLIRSGFTKVILRDAMKGIVPERILMNHRKVGFNAPISTLLNPAEPQVSSALLDRSPIFDHVRRDKIEKLLRKTDFPNSESKFLFYFLNSKMFLEEFAI